MTMSFRTIIWIAFALMLAACGGNDTVAVPTLDTRLTDAAPPTPVAAVITTEDAQTTFSESRVILPTVAAATDLPIISVDIPEGWQQFQGGSIANESMTVMVVVNVSPMRDSADYATWVDMRAETAQTEPRTQEVDGKRVDIFAPQEGTHFATADLGGGYVAEASLNSMTQNVTLADFEDELAAIIASARIES